MGWRVYAENVGATEEGRNLVLGMSESSVLKLKTMDFKPFLGMDRVTFKVSRAREEEGKGKEVEPPVLS